MERRVRPTLPSRPQLPLKLVPDADPASFSPSQQHPEHSHQAWLNHYKKVDKDGIERRIERIRRQRERDKDAARSAKGKQRARGDDDLPDDDDDDDDVQVKKPRPSTSRPTATDDAPRPTENKNKKRKALELPRPSSSSSSDEDLVKIRKRRAGCKKKYTAEDFKQLVRILYRAEQESWLKQRIYTALEAYVRLFPPSCAP